MKLKILGSGTSTGVPEIGCRCEVCMSKDSRDIRLRTSALVYSDDARILIDCGPDFRQQMLRSGFFEKIDGVLITHKHYDHIGGLDDLRPYGRIGEIPIYADTHTAIDLRNRMPYCFVDQSYPGIPRIYLEEVESGLSFFIKNTEILPLDVMHGKLPILGYLIGKRMAYITDMLSMPDVSYEQLHDLDVLVINALRFEPHATHQSISQALTVAERIGAKQTYFVHMNHHAGLHEEIERQLPPRVHFAFDGLEIHW